jgi:diguanylate cyclase (GGDEF)-like protein
LRIYPWFEVLQRREPLVEAIEKQNERAVNLWRLAMMCLLALVPAIALAERNWSLENSLGLGFLVFGVAYTSLVWGCLLLNLSLRWIQYATTVIDVTLVTLLLGSFMVEGRGIVAANSQTTFLVYFFALMIIGRRYHVPLAVFGGALVVVEYAALVAIGYFVYDLPHAPVDLDYGAFSWPHQVGRAALLVASASLMVSTVKHSRHLHELSIRDPLLGIYNRRFFEEVLALEFDYSRKLGKSLTVVMLDLDRFKGFNDRHGHLEGDRLLMAVSDYLLRHLRRNDVLARYGGDEFVFLLLETPPEGAGTMLSRLQGNMDKWLKDLLTLSDPPVNFSFGVASLKSIDTEPGDLLARADRHLYQAKAAGGGIICDEEGRIVPAEV